jgi:hypothetical protein
MVLCVEHHRNGLQYIAGALGRYRAEHVFELHHPSLLGDTEGAEELPTITSHHTDPCLMILKVRKSYTFVKSVQLMASFPTGVLNESGPPPSRGAGGGPINHSDAD